MKLLAFFLLVSSVSFGKSPRLFQWSQFTKTDSYVVESFEKNTAEFEFHFTGLNDSDTNATVQFSIDGQEQSLPFQSKQRLTIKTSSGPHVFLFYINSNYEEVVSDTIIITSRHRDCYDVRLVPRRGEEIYTYKPVLYLYPEVETEINVRVNIQGGKTPFFYPKSDGHWNVTAHEDGTLEVGEETFRYLFWEATQAAHLDQVTYDDGFIVTSNEAITFLENQLTQAGLNSIEQADFITFWGPKLASNPLNYVRFEWNETCDKFAELEITPKPDHVYRLYIFMAPIDEPFQVHPQQIPTIERTGFSAFEWGGQYSETLKTREL